MSDARERVLAAVRAALAEPGPGGPALTPDVAAAIARGRQAGRPDGVAARLRRFAAELEALAAELLSAADPADAAEQLDRHLREVGVESVAALPIDPLTAAVVTELEAAGRTIARLEQLAPAERRARLAATDTLITGADHALATTGTLVCTPATLPDRVAAGLPLRHVALLPADRLWDDLATLLAAHPEIGGRALLMISGPSRTADVEKTLVLGAHGPAALTVVLVGACRGE